MIRYKTKEGIFNFRAACIIIRNNKILAHRGVKNNDTYYALPGGRVEMHEDTATTVEREFKEELGKEIKVKRLLWINENFFSEKGERYHEIGFYYLAELANNTSLPENGRFYSVEKDEDGTPHLEFEWLDINMIKNVSLYPEFLKSNLGCLPVSPVHIIENI